MECGPGLNIQRKWRFTPKGVSGQAPAPPPALCAPSEDIGGEGASCERSLLESTH